MSVMDKLDLLNRMRRMIDGLFSDWAKEAKTHIDGMEKNMFNDTAFRDGLKEWEEKLLPQCPGDIWWGMRKGRITPPTVSATM